MTMTDTSPVIMRLPNSIQAWNWQVGAGRRWLRVQVGQSTQPRPEPVSRTAPPVTTISVSSTTDRPVILRYASGVRVGHRHARTDTGKDTVRWYGRVPDRGEVAPSGRRSAARSRKGQISGALSVVVGGS